MQIINLLYPELPLILCFTEHRLNHYEVHVIHTDNCNLGAKYCWHYCNKVGVRIFIRNN